MRRGQLLLAAVCAATLFAPVSAAADARTAGQARTGADGPGAMLLGVRQSPAALALIRAAGAEPVVQALGIWRLPANRAREVAAALRRIGAVRYLEVDRLRAAASVGVGDPLAAPEIGWHLYRVGADRFASPGPGVPITVIDSGLDTSHVEFRARPNTVFLNSQPALSWDTPGYHGTHVSSVAAAPADGVGAVGIFPDAVLRAYAVEAVFNAPLTSDIVRGLHRAASQGRTVINISLSGTTYSRSEHEAILSATRRGALVVAAAGNEGERGSPLEYPASLPHVLTVGATGATDAPSPFSSASAAVDLAAPGESIPVQHPSDPNVWKLVSGTSFATPIVAAAAAAVWTRRPELDAGQLAGVLRRSARDLGAPGFDTRTGFGLLDMPAALSLPAGPVDPQEPNDDIDQIMAGRLFASARAPLASPSRRTGRLRATLDRWEDPSDVYRVVIPRGRTLTVSVAASTDLAATLWGPRTKSVFARGATVTRDLLGTSNRPGRAVERISYRNRTRAASTVYVDVWPGRGASRHASYTLTATIR